MTKHKSVICLRSSAVPNTSREAQRGRAATKETANFANYAN
jgi:hypothetical protein